MFESLNKNFHNPFEVTIENAKCYKLSEVDLNEVYEVVSMFTNPNGKHGEYACLGIIADSSDEEYCWLLLPNHLIDAVKTILSTPEYIKAVNERHLGITVRKYYSKKYSKECFTVDFKDINFD